MGTRFPYGTCVINLTACVIIGFTLTYLGKRADLNPAWRFLVPVGFIGAYSTFRPMSGRRCRRCARALSFLRRSMQWAASFSVLRPPGVERRWPTCSKDRPRFAARRSCNFGAKVLQSSWFDLPPAGRPS